MTKIKLPEDADEATEQIYDKALKGIFDLLYHLDQVSLCDTVAKKLVSHSSRKDGDYRYYVTFFLTQKGLIHEKKK